jgi:hypothetical protein
MLRLSRQQAKLRDEKGGLEAEWLQLAEQLEA